MFCYVDDVSECIFRLEYIYKLEKLIYMLMSGMYTDVHLPFQIQPTLVSLS